MESKPWYKSLLATEDLWSVWLGLLIIALSYGLFVSGGSLAWIAVSPKKWSTLQQAADHFGGAWERYLAQFTFWAALLGLGQHWLGNRIRDFLPSFAVLYVGAVVIQVVGAWDQASRYSLEAPLVAVVVGALISNTIGVPEWMRAAFRVEYYIKVGIILLGATLPLTLLVWAGPLAIAQASVVSVVTFLVIFMVGRKLGLDRRLCATLGAGGAVCGVSAAVAVAGVVGARREHLPVAIGLVVLWALVMIFVLPFAAQTLHLHTAVAGAWIGASEFADAAGFAAAQAYGGMAAKAGIDGTPEQAVWSFTLMKVVGRDAWLGLWAFILAFVATTRWPENEAETVARPDVSQIWRRFPKFIFGFLVASALVTLMASGHTFSQFEKEVAPVLVKPIKELRTWAFVLCFLSIGLSTRFRDLAVSGARPFWAFTVGVAVNVVLGFVMAAVVFADQWKALGSGLK